MSRSIGLDVGATTIRVAEIESQGRSRRLVGLYEIARDPEQTPGAQVRQFFETSGVTADRIGMGTGAHPTILKSFEFPFSALKKVEPAVRGDFEDSLPVDITEHVLDVKPLGRTGKMFRFEAGLLPPRALQELDALGEESGVLINSYFSDLEALGQLALNQNLPASSTDAPYAVIDLGYSTTKVVFLRGGRPQFLNRKGKEVIPPRVLETRLILKGGRELLQWIEDKNGLRAEEATQWLVHRAEIQNDPEDGSTPQPNEISDSIKTALRPVIVELYQTLQSFRAQSGQPLFAVYLTGGLSGLRGLRDFLAAELRVPFHPWPIFEGFNVTGVPLTAERERAFAVALSIAHRWVSPATPGWLNFKRMTAQRKILTSLMASLARPELSPVLRGAALALAFAWIYNGVGSHFLGRQSETVETDLTGEFRKLDRDLARRAARFAEDPKMAVDAFRQEKQKRTRAEAAKGTKVTSRARAEVFLDISQLLPAKAQLKELTMSESGGGTVRVESIYAPATLPSADDVKTTLAQLTPAFKARGYSQVSLDLVPGGRALSLKATWKGGSL